MGRCCERYAAKLKAENKRITKVNNMLWQLLDNQGRCWTIEETNWHPMTGYEFKTRRIEAGLTQSQLAKRAGVGISRISYLERTPSYRMTARVFKKFKTIFKEIKDARQKRNNNS